MIKLKEITSIILLLLPLYACAEVKNESVHISKGKYSNYYHINYKLLKDQFTFSTDESGKSYADYTEQNLTDAGGQFEILIPMRLFPVSSTNCKHNIILRMPWSDSSSEKEKLNVNNKVKLFNSLKNINQSKLEALNVVIELNPYVKPDKKSAMGVTLTGCNVFFRHSKGEYLNFIGDI